MKKLLKGIVLAVLALTMTFALASCGETENGSGSTGSNGGGTQTDKTIDATIDAADLKNLLGTNKLYATTIGQADLSTVTNILKRVGFAEGDYTEKSLLGAEEVEDGATVVIVVGMSNKGLGSAGTSASQEEARANAFAAKKNSINIIACHVGGKERRGASSDGVIKTVAAASKVTMVVDDGNGDGGDYDNMISNHCKENNVPCYLYSKASQTVNSFKFLLGK